MQHLINGKNQRLKLNKKLQGSQSIFSDKHEEKVQVQGNLISKMNYLILKLIFFMED
jgi:hypothetical protein